MLHALQCICDNFEKIYEEFVFVHAHRAFFSFFLFSFLLFLLVLLLVLKHLYNTNSCICYMWEYSVLCFHVEKECVFIKLRIALLRALKKITAAISYHHGYDMARVKEI